MANKIVLKKSSVVGKVPTSGDLDIGELAVNLADAKLYTKDASNTVIELGAGTGDVVGPASATDNAIVRYDGTTGKLVQNSTVTVDNNGNVINANSIGFDTTPATVPTTDGTMSWDDGDGVPSVLLKGGNTTLQVGTQEYARVYNDSGTTLTKGQVVYISGAQGNRIAVKLARANVEATSFGTIGLVAESIANGAEGFIIVSGALNKLNTTGLTAGSTVYLSPTTAGGYTTTKPQAPDQLVVLGWVERVDNIVGSIYVKVDNGYELDELHDVRITSPQSGNTLIYDATAGVWKNSNLTAGSGITITEGAGTITIATSGGSGTYARTSITATSGQTVFTVSYVVGYVEVFLNGVLLNSADYTATNGTSVTLATSATAGDIVEFIAYNALAVGLAVGLQGGTAGQIPYQTAPDTTSFITNGTTGQVLTSNGSSAPTWQTPTNGTVTSVAATAGTGISVTGSPITSSGTLTITNTAPDQVVSITGGTGISATGTYPNFTVTNTAPDQTVVLTGGGATTVTGTYPNFTISSVNTTYSAATSTTLGLIELGSDTVQTVAANSVSATASRTYAIQVNAAGQAVVNVPWTDTNSGGTVTSVGGTGTVSGLTLTGTVTTSGNLTLGGTLSVTPSNFSSQTANTFLAAPNGTAGVPSFRSIVAADIPTLNQNTTGTASNVTGTVAIANGGTGQTTKAAGFNALSPITTTGDLIIGNGSNSATRLAIGTAGQVLTSNGTTASWQNASSGGISAGQVFFMSNN